MSSTPVLLRVSKIIGFLLGALCAAFAATALFLLITWDGVQLQAQITREIRERLQRPLAMEHPPRLLFLPSPTVVIDGLALGSRTGVGIPVKAARIEASLALAPLLRGNFEVNRLRVLDPELSLQRQPDGTLDLADLQAASPETPMLLVPPTKSDSDTLSQSLRAMGAMSGRAAEAGSIRQIGELTLDGTAARIEWRGRRVDLTLSEFRVVQLLVDRSGQDASYRDIYDTVKGVGFIAGTGTDGYRANVRAMVKRIRQKFKEADKAFSAIHNYPGFGYRWIAEA